MCLYCVREIPIVKENNEACEKMKREKWGEEWREIEFI